MSFDPYYQWLGIPPEEQPPHHYRLLGIKPLEENLDVIETAADRQMLHLRTYQAGKQADASQSLLNEIAAAKIALLDPAKKRAYDATLQSQTDSAVPEFPEVVPQELLTQPATSYSAPPPPTPLAPRSLPIAVPLPSLAANEVSSAGPSVQRASPSIARRRSNSSMILVAAGGVVLILLAIGAAVALSMLGNDQEEIVAQNPTNPDLAATTSVINSGSNNDDERPAPVVPPVTLKIEPTTTNDPPDGEAETPTPETPVAAPPTESLVDDAPPTEEPRTLIDNTDKPSKLPVPEKAAREAKRQEILAIFPVADARTPAAKHELAAKLIATARSSEADTAAQFALLNLAREQAAEAHNLKLAFEAIDLLAEKFEFDADAVRVTSVHQATKTAMPPAEKREIVVTGMSLVEQLAAADKFDEADALSDKLLTFARPLRDNELTKSIVERRRAIGDQAAIFRRVQAAFDTLKESPDNPDANLAVGHYLTFVKQDWNAGLKHLAKGSDAALAAAATAELAAPETPAGQEKLADAWWDAAEAQKDAFAKDHCRTQAVDWYCEIVNQLTGLAKVRVDQRIVRAKELVNARRPSSAKPIMFARIVTAKTYVGDAQTGLNPDASTGVFVAKGQAVAIKVEGSWKFRLGNGPGVGPEGTLVVAVGEAGKPAYQEIVASARDVSFVTEQAGLLFFGINDRQRFDNSGELSLSVMVEH